MRAFFVVLLLAGVAGCGGGAGITPSPPSPPGTTGTAVISIAFPSGQNATAAWVSPSTARLVIAVSQGGGTPATTSAPCAPPACTVSLTVPAGTDSLTLTGLDASGKTLSTSSTSVSVVGSQSTALTPTLHPVPAAVTVLASPAALPIGTPSAITLTVVAKDADANTIGTPATYASPLTVTVSGGASFALSVPAFIGTGQAITATYTGSATQQVVAFGVSAGGLSPAQVTAANVPVVSARPVIPGSTFSYTGTMVQQVVTNEYTSVYATPSPPATPLATSSQTFTYTSTQQVTVTATASPAVDQHTVENDVLNGNGQLATIASDAILVFPSGYSGNLTESSLTWNNALGANSETATTDVTVYGSGNGTIDVLPETTGATWSNTATHTEDESSSDGRLMHLAANSDGSYHMTLTGPPPYDPTTNVLEDVTENTDASGTFIGECGLFYCSFPAASRQNNTWTFQTPAGTTQSIVFTDPKGKTSTTAVALWYALPAVLWNDTGVVKGTVSIPASCNVSNAVASSATEVDRTTSVLDTIVGYTETTATMTYDVLGIGVVCTASTDVLTTYYDYTGANGDFPTFFGTVVSKTTTTQTLGLQASSLATLASLRRPAALAASIVRPSNAAFFALVKRGRDTALAARAARTHGGLTR